MCIEYRVEYRVQYVNLADTLKISLQDGIQRVGGIFFRRFISSTLTSTRACHAQQQFARANCRLLLRGNHFIAAKRASSPAIQYRQNSFSTRALNFRPAVIEFRSLSPSIFFCFTFFRICGTYTHFIVNRPSLMIYLLKRKTTVSLWNCRVYLPSPAKFNAKRGKFGRNRILKNAINIPQ